MINFHIVRILCHIKMLKPYFYGKYLILILCDIHQTKFLEFQYILQYSIQWFTEILCCQIILMLTELHNSTLSRPTVTCTYVTITMLNDKLF
jgi:hypothetical protein